MAKAWKAEGLTAATSVDVAAPILLGLKLAELRHHADRATLRTDPEDLHALRVAARRLRAALALVGGPLSELAGGVQRLGHVLGQLRDHDVTIAWLDEQRDAAALDERPGIEGLRARWHAELPPLEALLGPALAAFEAHVGQPLTLRMAESGWPGPLDGKRVRRRVAKRLDRMARCMAELDSLEDVAAVHELRIAAKKVRYDLELVEEILVDVAGEALARLKPLQSLLGDLHDADVRLALLPQVVVAVARADQPGAIRLLASALDARRTHAAELNLELDRWSHGAAAQLMAQRVEAGPT